ncbi:amidohydrolase family protein [bacterium]|nr:amidohydrolase family protein [bacterium]
MRFDANVRLGRLGGSRGRYFATGPALVAAMDRFGVSHSLVYHALARESDYARGNLLLQELIRGHPRLVPCWVAVPHREQPAELLRRMDEHRVRAVRLFPRSGHFSIRPWCTGDLADALGRAGKVLILDFENPSWPEETIDWEGLSQLCAACPKLPVLVVGVTVAGPVNYAGLLPQCPNLHLELSQLACPGEIRRLVERGFEDRLLFGSDLPTRHIGGPLTMLQWEAIDEPARAAILGGNMARLLGAPQDTPAVPGPITRRPVTVIDTHVHLGGWNSATAGSGDAADIVREMDRCGITSIVATSLWSCYGEVLPGNQAVADAAAAFPGRIHGYLTLDPKHPAEVDAQLARHGGDPSFVGVKLHCGTHRVPVADPRCAPILEYADRRGWPVLVHEEFDPGPWRDVCGRYPRTRFIVAHVGGGGPDHDLAIELARACRQIPNLYLDLASSRVFYGFLEELVELAGADRILYGSDHPLFDFGFELGQVLHSELDRADQDRVLAGNARRLFNLP